MKTLQEQIIAKQDELIRHLTHEHPDPAPPSWYIKKHKLESELSALKAQAKQEKACRAPIDKCILCGVLKERHGTCCGEENAIQVEKVLVTHEFHVWVIPDNNEIFVEDRGCGVPIGATEHIVFDTWEGALKLGQFLAKFCHYNLELDNEAGRFAEHYQD